MSIRTFVFCDVCNGGATRYVEQRRGTLRGDTAGRRVTDGRAWVEAIESQAVGVHGWRVSEAGTHVCPRCQDLPSAPR